MSTDSFKNSIYTADVTIAASGTISSVFDAGNHTLSALVTPTGMTGTALTFQVSVDGTTYRQMRQVDGTAYTVVVDGTAAYYTLHPQDFAGARFIKVVSGTAEGASRAITLVSIKAMENPA